LALLVYRTVFRAAHAFLVSSRSFPFPSFTLHRTYVYSFICTYVREFNSLSSIVAHVNANARDWRLRYASSYKCIVNDCEFIIFDDANLSKSSRTVCILWLDLIFKTLQKLPDTLRNAVFFSAFHISLNLELNR
jgi:hypothetical protein